MQPNRLGPPNALFPDQAPTLADGWQYNANAYQGWLDQQRQSGVAAGMLDPQTGWPTGNALLDAARQYGGAMIGSTAAPGAKMSAMQGPGKGMISPSKLTFREGMQNNAATVRELFPQGEGYFPIVTTTTKDGAHTILDGHNRAVVAAERGDDLPYVSLPSEAYEELHKHGFDDQEISYAALTNAGENDAAAGIDYKFPGASVAERGGRALDKLWDMPGYE